MIFFRFEIYDFCTNFRHNTVLQIPPFVHTGGKPHKCDHCDKAFVDRSTLGKHMLLHTGERPYTCQVCGKSFTQRGTLTTHMVTHTRETPHQCDHCDKAFSNSSNLCKHMLVHTREAYAKSAASPSLGEEILRQQIILPITRRNTQCIVLLRNACLNTPSPPHNIS